MTDEPNTGTEPGKGAQALSQDAVNALLAQQKREHREEMKQLREQLAAAQPAVDELAKLREQSKSETEKAIEAASKKAREDAIAEKEREYAGKELRSEIKLELISRGYPANLVGSVIDSEGVDKPEAVKDAVGAFLKANNWPEKFDGKAPAPGFPGGPAPATAVTGKIKRSQLRDPKFFREHQAEIGQAMALGQIEDDLT